MKIKLQEKLHDDLGSRLTVIVLMIDEILRSIREGAVVNTNEPLETLTDISQIGSSTVINMRKLLWANDNANDEMSNVLQQINTNKEELYPKIELIVTISENLKTLKIDGNKRYHIISIFDEALINIRKYADATKVKVNFDCKNNWFSMIIQDNGKGFESEKEKEKSALSGREGIRNMINRAKKMNGRLTITSKLKIGTMILLEIPLKETLFFQRLKRIFYTSYLKR